MMIHERNRMGLSLTETLTHMALKEKCSLNHLNTVETAITY